MGRACKHVRRRRPVRRDDGAAGPPRLLEDIQAGKVQIVVVYKVDRLTRSLADFAKIVDILDAHNASFVSFKRERGGLAAANAKRRRTAFQAVFL